MARHINPFIVAGKIQPEYFCDRVAESERLIKTVTNGNNLVLISPRRMGKTGLIRFCYDKPVLRDNYYTFFIDILQTSSLREFIYLLGREIFSYLLPRSQKMMRQFLSMLKSINGKFGFDALSGTPTFNLQLGDIDRPEYTLAEIFQYLSSADMPCVVAIDEFQQITKYPEKNVEAILRSHIQGSSNVNFIFAGSERHLMQEMFSASSRPFYNSADILELKEIPLPIYSEFVTRLFAENGKNVDSDVIVRVYELFGGHTYYMQRVFNGAYADTLVGDVCKISTAQKSLDDMLAANDTVFREILSNIPERQKELLYAIAREGVVEKITSAAFVRNNHLLSASSVQASLKKLLEMDYVTVTDRRYSVTDRLFGMWINTIYGDASVARL